MPQETCEHHMQFASDMAVMKNDLHYIRSKVCQHVDDGEKEGGFRDRLLLAEKEIMSLRSEIKAIARGRWIIGFVSGTVSTLIATGSRDVLLVFIKWIMGMG